LLIAICLLGPRKTSDFKHEVIQSVLPSIVIILVTTWE
jgi:hypothetical protein